MELIPALLIAALLTLISFVLLIRLASWWWIRTYVSGPNPRHLIVIQHGYMEPYLRSAPLLSAVAQKAREMAERSDCDGIGHFVVHSNITNGDDDFFGWIRTNDGIDNGGQRLAECIIKLVKEYPSLTHLSLIGSSLGGLYSRFALKQLYQQGYLHSMKVNSAKLPTPRNLQYSQHQNGTRLKCLNLITLSTPHLGVADYVFNRPSLMPVSLIKWLMHDTFEILPRTIAQIVRLDDPSPQKCLLTRMANEKQFIEPLTLFERVICYSNALNDRIVSFSSAAVLRRTHADGSYATEMSPDWIKSGENDGCCLTNPSEAVLLDESEMHSNFVCKVSDRIDGQLFARLSRSDLKSGMSNSSSNDGNQRNDINDNGNEYPSPERPMRLRESKGDDWFIPLQTQVDWQRFVCFMHQGWVSRRFAHELLAIPLSWLSDCQPLVKHLFNHFQWSLSTLD